MLDATLTYVKEREAFGQPIAGFQNTRFQLAETSAQLEAAQRLVGAAVEKHSDGSLSQTDAAKLKLHASEFAKQAVDTCLQLHGGYGYILEYPVAQAFLAVRLMTIFGGTSEVLKETIAHDLLG